MAGSVPARTLLPVYVKCYPQAVETSKVRTAVFQHFDSHARDVLCVTVPGLCGSPTEHAQFDHLSPAKRGGEDTHIAADGALHGGTRLQSNTDQCEDTGLATALEEIVLVHLPTF